MQPCPLGFASQILTSVSRTSKDSGSQSYWRHRSYRPSVYVAHVLPPLFHGVANLVTDRVRIPYRFSRLSSATSCRTSNSPSTSPWPGLPLPSLSSSHPGHSSTSTPCAGQFQALLAGKVHYDMNRPRPNKVENHVRAGRGTGNR